jgi:hypothetical protein
MRGRYRETEHGHEGAKRQEQSIETRGASEMRQGGAAAPMATPRRRDGLAESGVTGGLAGMQERGCRREKSRASLEVTGGPVPGSTASEFPPVRYRVLARGRTGSSPAHPFGSLATSSGTEAHGFAPPPYDGFALSRMKGVVIRARHQGLPTIVATKAGNLVCCSNSRMRFPNGQTGRGRSSGKGSTERPALSCSLALDSSFLACPATVGFS